MAKERCRRTLATPGGVIIEEGDLDALQAIVTGRPPTFKAREKGAAQKYREVATKTASSRKFAAASMLAEYGFSTDRPPPYEKWFNGTELWWVAIKNYYRFPAASDRRDKGVAGLALGGMWRAGGREASGYIPHTDDFALAVADRQSEMLIRADADLEAALRKRDLAQGGM